MCFHDSLLAMIHLPAEIWLQIFSDLEPLENRQTLVNLCLTSKTLHNLARSLLYSVITAKDLRNPSVLDSLCNASHDTSMALSVREVFTECCLVAEKGEASSIEEHWKEGEVATAQAKVRASWLQTISVLKNCIAITSFHFSVDCLQDLHGADPITTEDDELLYEIVPMPHEDSLLNLPFLHTLRKLALQSPNATQYSDYGAFGQLVVACPHLTNVSLHQIKFRTFFRPILEAVSANRPLALRCIEWDESILREDADLDSYFEELLPVLAKLPSLRQIRFVGDMVDCACLCESELQQTLRLPQIQHVTLLEDGPDHRAEHRDKLLPSLSLYFPSLLTLTITFNSQEIYGTANATFEHLQSLIVIDRHLHFETPSFPMFMLNRAFTPKLSSLKYVYKCQTVDDKAYMLGPIEPYRLLAFLLADSSPPNLELIEVETGMHCSRLRRQDSGFVVY